MAEPVPPAPALPPSDGPQRRKISNLLVVWGFTRRYPLQLLIAIVALIGSSLTTLLIPRTFQKIVDHGFAAGADTSRIGIYFQGLLLVVVALAAFTAVRFYFVSWLAERTVADLRMAVHRNLLRLPPKWFEENRPSEIASRLTADTAVVEQVVGSTVSIALRNLLTGAGGVIYLFALAPKIAAYLVVGIPVTILPIVWLGSRVRQFSRTSQDRVADVGAIASETLGAMRIVQAFGQEQREAERFQGAVTRTFEAGKRRFGLRAIMTALVIGSLFTASTLIVWAAVADAAAGRPTGARPPRPPPVPCHFPSRPRARSPSTGSPSAIPPARTAPRSPTSRSRSAPARRWRWSAPRAPASRRSSSCSSASTIPMAAKSVSTVYRSLRPIRPISARAWRWCRRRR